MKSITTLEHFLIMECLDKCVVYEDGFCKNDDKTDFFIYEC
jgi:hypothetical protein